MNQAVEFFLALNLHYQNFQPERLGWLVEALIEVVDSWIDFIATTRIFKIRPKLIINSKNV